MLRILILLCFLTVTHGVDLSPPVCTCPDSCSEREELGRGTWRLLHSIAEHIEPTERNRYRFQSFLNLLAELYPCSVCRQHLRTHLDTHRPELDPISMCRFHNIVNEQLGKPAFHCASLFKAPTYLETDEWTPR